MGVMKKVLRKIFSFGKERHHLVFYILGIKLALSVGKKNTCDIYSKEIGWVDHEIIHIMHKTRISVELVKFLNSFVDHKKHLFIFKSGPSMYDIDLSGDNVVYGNLMTLRVDLRKTEKIIMHSMLQPQDIAFLYKFPQLLKITYWVIFGGDLYSYTPTYKTEFVKSNIKAVLTAFDMPEYIRRFGEKPSFEIIWPDDTIKDLGFRNRKKDEPVNILVNNCIEKSTPELLSKLAKFKDENIRIHVILSYLGVGTTRDVKDEIEKLGKSIFGDKFIPVYNWMSSDEFCSYLQQMDVYLLGMKRQQGISNLRTTAVCGAKLFMNSQNIIWGEVLKTGLKLGDTNEIENMSFEEFCHISEADKINNKEVFLRRADGNHIKMLWSRVFDDKN